MSSASSPRGPVGVPDSEEAAPRTGRMRADARRNRAQILAAAEAAFAEEGVGVPVDEIARRAGVGAGTLYRNFPTKEHLFQAVIGHHMASVAAQARALADSDEPGRAFFDFVGRLVDEASAKRNLIDALMGAGVDVKESLSDQKADVEHAAKLLLDRAQLAGAVRRDVTLAEVFGLMMGACAFSGPAATESSRARMVSVLCDGLRPSQP